MTTSPARAGFESLDLRTHYRTGESDPVQRFYRPCLTLASTYARAVGYFRSSIYAIVGTPMLDFARRGGTMRLVCSPSITEEDAAAISSGYAMREAVVETSLARDIDSMLANEAIAPRAKLLATLIKCGNLDLKVAIRSQASGIYHEKLGVFTDPGGRRVSFLGSANETWSAWHADGNHESIEVFREWHGGGEAERVENHAAHFERLWNGEVTGVETMAFPAALRQRLLDIAAPGYDDIDGSGPPPEAKARSPQQHQLDAIAAWEMAGRLGIFEHATGSGKTFTAITIIKKHLEGGQPALVLVPSQLLLEQWRTEIASDIPDATILLAGAGHIKWREGGRLRSHLSAGLGIPVVVLATMQTAATDLFLREAQGGSHLLLIADEVHQIGSRFNARAMAIRSGPVLGLSATPTRHGDPEGTAAILDRFGPVVQPVITLQDAIHAGRLVDYEYFPHALNLDQDEAEEWAKLTKQISLELARSKSDDQLVGRMSDKVRMMLIRRSRIAKKARVKPGLAAAVIKREYRAGQRWLVYCEDSEQLAEAMRRLIEVGIQPVEYHSGMAGDRAAALAWFRSFGGVLVSIKCLDEGVDIPAVSHALILASSQNPRQFIQRRGRVLRKSQGKNLAVIHDAIVVPIDLGAEPDQTSLLKAELLRALHFSDSAINKGAGAELRAIALGLGYDIDSAKGAGIEEDDE